ncbi:helix-turn-helix transcriptional regulator [Methylotetracoccus oryzae]|uniref:helix-turn-helix transcriptional regulator n=1 Tax=Methylotetracoccus oryzae TaxID=1919059 RepID=UPI001118117F|nr:AraC family transcriptional regulator [Methylotetracoccus oryzae]
MPALTSLVEGLNLKAKLTYWGGVCGEWLMDHDSDHQIWFHLLSKGEGWVHSSTRDLPLRLTEGDLIVFLPHAPKHVMTYSPHHIPADNRNVRVTTVPEGEVGLVCGSVELVAPNAGMWRAIPAEILIRREQAGEILSRLIQLIIAESAAPRLGSGAVVERLSDSILVLVLRHCMENDLIDHGLFRALQDGKIGAVLTAIHREPGRAWTLNQLCEEAAVSKSGLIKRFTEVLGCAPMEYLANWRMQLAMEWLKSSPMTIEAVSEFCGYQSTSAFSKAFKRVNGTSPGQFRRDRCFGERGS